MKALDQRAASLLGVPVVDSRRLHGGDLSEVARLHTAAGHSLVAKGGGRCMAEADMLKAIAAAGVPAPRVVAVSRDVLVLEDLGYDDGPSRAWGDLGRSLRRLHESIGEAYGWPVDHGFGPVPIPNGAMADWPTFWAERRLLPSCRDCPPEIARRIESLVRHLPDRLPARPPASLLHGDLWAGNIMARGSRITGLIDPACYHGHAEVDLAMLSLFGNPGPAFRAAYGPPEPGFAERQPIYQLWPALVHLRLFGTGYLGLVERCVALAG